MWFQSRRWQAGNDGIITLFLTRPYYIWGAKQRDMLRGMDRTYDGTLSASTRWRC